MTDPDEQRSAGRVRVRRAPRFGRFAILGGFVAIVVALILTTSRPIDPNVGIGPTFVIFALYSLIVCELLAAIVALVFDRLSRRGARTVDAERSRPVDRDDPQRADSSDTD